MVHHTLEGRRGVGESERHYLEFKQPVPGSECDFPFVSFYSYKVEPILQV